MSRGSLLLVFLISIATVCSPAFAAEGGGESCQCQESSCGPCEIETGTTFYSAKCGPSLSKVKSCKKPTCEPVENQKQCLALLNQSPKTPESAEGGRSIASEASGDGASGGSNSKGQARALVAGEITELLGTAKITRTLGGKEAARKGLTLFEGDVVETSSGSKVKIALRDNGNSKDSSELVLTPNSRMRLERVRAESVSGPRDVTLKLLSGKLRSRVLKKPTGDVSFRVTTRSAVAGVRGTDFVTSYEPGEKEWITEVRTFDGKVELGGAVPPANGAPARTIQVTAGTYAAFVVPAPPKDADDQMIKDAIQSGELSPLLLMKPDDSKLLDEATDLRASDVVKAENVSDSRTVASSQSDFVCQEPSGQYNQCSWTCEGKIPKGEKSCRTDLPGVSCVRRLCRANGQWAEAKRLPSSQSDLCVPDHTVVRDCGAYW